MSSGQVVVAVTEYAKDLSTAKGKIKREVNCLLQKVPATAKNKVTKRALKKDDRKILNLRVTAVLDAGFIVDGPLCVQRRKREREQHKGK